MYSLILLAGGNGNRMNCSRPKQFLPLAGKPVIAHSLERIARIREITELVIVCAEGDRREIGGLMREFGMPAKHIQANAGATRQESVYNGLLASTNDHVIIHEAVRPFVKTEDFLELIEHDGKNVILASPIAFTVIQSAYDRVAGVINRDEVRNVQLPHKYERHVLLLAHEKARQEDRFYTEDAGLLYDMLGTDIACIPGKEYNIKITYPIDMVFGEAIYKEYFL